MAYWCQLSNDIGPNQWQVISFVYKILRIYLIFSKFAWANFWIPKLNFCSKFVQGIIFFVLFENAAPNSWINKGSNFGTIYESTGISWRKLDFIPWLIRIFNYLKNTFRISRRWTQLNFENFNWTFLQMTLMNLNETLESYSSRWLA